jgi:hypothetical protein
MEALAIDVCGMCGVAPGVRVHGAMCEGCLEREIADAPAPALDDLRAAQRDRDAAHTACAEAQSEVVRLRQTIHEQADLIGRMNQALEQMRIEAAQIALQRDQWRRLHDASEAHRLDVTREAEALRILEGHVRKFLSEEPFWRERLAAVDAARPVSSTPPAILDGTIDSLDGGETWVVLLDGGLGLALDNLLPGGFDPYTAKLPIREGQRVGVEVRILISPPPEEGT